MNLILIDDGVVVFLQYRDSWIYAAGNETDHVTRFLHMLRPFQVTGWSHEQTMIIQARITLPYRMVTDAFTPLRSILIPTGSFFDCIRI